MNSYIGEEQREKTIFYHFKNNRNVFFGHKNIFFSSETLEIAYSESCSISINQKW